MNTATDMRQVDPGPVLREEYAKLIGQLEAVKEQAELRGVTLVEPDANAMRFQTATEFIEQHPTQAEPLIDELCRRGETVNVIGSTKEGKSWMILGMALSIAQGVPWLGRDVTQGKVALVDNELQPGTLSARIRTVAYAMCCPDDVLETEVYVLSLRGDLASLRGLRDPLLQIADDGVVMVGLDAFYRFIPSGTSENDNAQMAELYNEIDHLAGMLGATFVLNHHSTKGDQSGKSVTDVGSGAGSISRAADTHLIIRPHNEPGLAVLDAACRSFPPIPGSSLKFEFPLWSVSDEEPALKQRPTRGDAKKKADDTKGKATILDVLADGWMIRSAVRVAAGMGADRCNRLLRELLDDEKIQTDRRPNPRNKSELADYFRCH